MLLGVIPMICFEILSDFWRKLQKGKLGKQGLLRCSVGNPCCSVGNPRHDVALRRSVGCPRRNESRVSKWHPLGYTTA